MRRYKERSNLYVSRSKILIGPVQHRDCFVPRNDALRNNIMFSVNNILRNNIKNLTPYSSARDEFQGEASVYLDANENAFGSPLHEQYNRYPDPLQIAVKKRLSEIKGVPVPNIFLGNGSDEAIDILFRSFCNPGIDNVIIVPPTYGMYQVSANINDVEARKVNLTVDYQLNMEGIAEAIDEHTKMIFICSPNNPTGNSINRTDVETLLANFNGIVVVDEAYINYSRQKTFIQELTEYANLVVLQTLSKAWGLAGLRLGMAFASEEIIEVMNKVKPPYNINEATQQLVLQALQNVDQVNHWIKQTLLERDKLVLSLKRFDFVQDIYPSDANFILVKTTDARGIYNHLVGQGIIVRDRSKVELCEGCLRITVGTPEENVTLTETLETMSLI
ncbi:Histidinol-phosphate aminotransferase [Mucilaginibacter paludis DSM 18603]|uniref:Histidinol-phosphate aminotransferase n=2 Tax=Mucilaginibacter TaxID=423349 RepID=H1Y9T9_9SPHI|nr:Histidinol-phosphate aminotransferase [Mucilaginibacter paludis DSM 18603]